MNRCAWSILACLCMPLMAVAQPAGSPRTVQDLEQLQAAQLSPEQVVDDFHRRLAEGWKQGAEAHLDPQLLLFEQGYIEGSRQSYAGGQLYSDMVFAAATQRRLLHRRSGTEGKAAWVLSQLRVRGQVGGQQIDLETTETALLHQVEGRWRIQHLHWSAHPVGGAGAR